MTAKIARFWLGGTPMEPQVDGTATAACGRLVRTVAGRVVLAWLFLQLLLHLGVLIHQDGVLEDPLDRAVRQARWTVLSREIAFVWPELPGGKQESFTLASLEERAHQWMATLGAALEVDTWRVVRRTGDPLVLGLAARSPDGIAVELWLQSSPWFLGQGAEAVAPSLTLRLQAPSEAAWQSLTARLGNLAWPGEGHVYLRPQVLLTYRLRAGQDGRGQAVDRLAQALSARILEPSDVAASDELWLVTPRAAPLPSALHAAGNSQANVRLRWLRRDRGAGQGQGGAAWVAEVVTSPHALTHLGQMLERMSSPHIPGKSWTG